MVPSPSASDLGRSIISKMGASTGTPKIVTSGIFMLKLSTVPEATPEIVMKSGFLLIGQIPRRSNTSL